MRRTSPALRLAAALVPAALAVALAPRADAACGEHNQKMCVEWKGKPVVSGIKRSYCKKWHQSVFGICKRCGDKGKPACLVASDGPHCREELKLDKGLCVKESAAAEVVARLDPIVDEIMNGPIGTRIYQVCGRFRGKALRCPAGFSFNPCLAKCFERALKDGVRTRPLDVTFLVASDIHFGQSSFSDYDRARHVWEMNRFAAPAMGSRWPAGLASAGQPIAEPRFVVTTGDLTLWGHGDEIRGYRRYYEHKPGDASTLRFPVFDGLGNHDYDNAFYNRSFRIMPYMRAKFAGSPDIRSLHLPSLNYSWDWGDVHFVQTHRFAGDKASHESSLAWLQKDLRERVGSSGRPVVIFAHYGYDSFSREPRWWKDEDRRALAEVLRGYNVLAYIHGHVHGPWMGAMDPAPGRAVPSIAVGRGGQWGTGYFLAVRITERFIDIARATWEDPAEWAPVPDGTPGASCNEEKKDCRKAQPRPTTFPSITQGPSAQYPAPRIEAVHTARIGGWKPGR